MTTITPTITTETTTTRNNNDVTSSLNPDFQRIHCFHRYHLILLFQ